MGSQGNFSKLNWKNSKQQTELEKKIEEYNQAAEDKKAELRAEAEQLRTALDKSINTFKKELAKETK